MVAINVLMNHKPTLGHLQIVKHVLLAFDSWNSLTEAEWHIYASVN